MMNATPELNEPPFGPTINGVARKPIGYLAERLGSELTRYVDRALGSRYGIQRAHWQLLRTASEGAGIAYADFIKAARIFYPDDKTHTVIQELKDAGLVVESPDRILSLSAEGERVLAFASETQANTWTVLMRGVSDSDYAVTAKTLQAMIVNLVESEDSSSTLP